MRCTGASLSALLLGVEFKDIKVNIKGGPLGAGSFGTVFRGTFKAGGRCGVEKRSDGVIGWTSSVLVDAWSVR